MNLQDYNSLILQPMVKEMTVDMINDNEGFSFWPNCPVEGCADKVCLTLDSDKCFVHTPGWAWWKRRKIWWRDFKYRVKGAWLVYRGKADWQEE